MKKLFDCWRAALAESLTAQSVSPRLQKILVGLVLLAALVVRVVAMDAPMLDRTNWKEIDYLAVSSNYREHGYNFFRPEITWPAEPPRATAMELPVVPYLASLLYALFGFNVYSARLVTLLSFLVMSVYVFRLTKRELGPLVGLSAMTASLVMPLYHEFGHTLFSDPAMLAASVAALFYFAEWVDRGRRLDWVLAVVSFSLAVALKLEPLYLLLPLLWIACRKNGWKLKRYGGFIAFVACSMLLPLAWYAYAYFLARTSIDVFGVFGGQSTAGGHNKFQTVKMLSSSAWYRTMYERVAWDILGGRPGLLLCMAGMAAAAILRRGGLFFFYLLAVCVYFALVAEGQLDAPYRQLAIIPALSVFVGFGAVALMTLPSALRMTLEAKPLAARRRRAQLVLAASLVLLVVSAVRQRNVIFRDPTVPAEPVRWALAEVIRRNAAPGSLLVTAGEYSIHVGGNDLSPLIYYYSGLQGWTLERPGWTKERVEELVQKGATHFVATDMQREPDADPFLRELKSRYKILYEDQRGLILDLRQEK